MSKKIVVGSVSKPSLEELLAMYEKFDGQSSEIRNQFRRGALTPRQVQDLIEHRNPFLSETKGIGEGIGIDQALTILGFAKVLTADQAARAWNKDIPQNVPIRHSEATLRECATLNKAAGTDWRLVYVFGLSIRQQREMEGTHSSCQSYFHDTKMLPNEWLKKEETDKKPWVTQDHEAGYYLIDFNGQWGGASWNGQEANITNLGSDYERAQEAVITESIISIFWITGGRLLRDWHHWGQSRDSCGRCIFIGYFAQGGLDIGSLDPDNGKNHDDNLRVCLSRKPDAR